jgi:hypothetical protein
MLIVIGPIVHLIEPAGLSLSLIWAIDKRVAPP